MEKVMSDEKVLSIDEILASDTVEYATIPGAIPGEVMRIQSLSAGAFIDWQEAGEGEAKRTAGLRLIVQSLVDEDGKRICTDKHIAAFRAMKHKTTENIIRQIIKHNGLKVAAE
jgi:hypothetical protein